jgi:hypothetical protein
MFITILNKANPVHDFPPHFSKIHCNIILPSMPRSCKWFSLQVSWPQFCTHFSSILCVLHVLPISSSWSDHPNKIWWNKCLYLVNLTLFITFNFNIIFLCKKGIILIFAEFVEHLMSKCPTERELCIMRYLSTNCIYPNTTHQYF